MIFHVHRPAPDAAALAAATLCVCALLAACAPAGSTGTPGGPTTQATATVAGSPSASAAGLDFTPISVEGAQRKAAGIEIAFTADAAAGLVATRPTGIEFARSALLCVYLGERTGPWTLNLDEADLGPGQLAIQAREVRPRPGASGGDSTTYPAACATINAKALPAGTLVVRADDTTSGELIVSVSVTVPAQ